VRPLIRDEPEDIDYKDSSIQPIKIEPYSLRGQRLQVISKMVDYELAPGDSYEVVWHVEGMSHEDIVATAIYFIHRDKTRMMELSRHPKAFVRPSPSKGVLCGLSSYTNDVVSLCEAAGYELVLVETVGLGQSEVDVRYASPYCITWWR